MTQHTQLAIIGGGIAGLSAGWYAQQHNIDYTLLEKSARFGGLIHSEYHDDLTIEFGPDAVITRKPHAKQLAEAIGLGDEIIAVNDTPERIYILSDGDLVPMPDGVRLLVPTDLMAWLQSPLLTWEGRKRALDDLIIPPKDDDADESLADFVTRRMGAEVLDKLADPLLAGVYNAEMDKQSILATFPQYRALEKAHGSLIKGMAHARQSAPASDNSPALISFRQGLQQFINTLRDRLSGDLRLNTGVSAIVKGADGGYTLTLSDGETLHAQQIIAATPANITAHLLADVVPHAAQTLNQIRYAGVGNLSLAYRPANVPRPLDAYGIVIPNSEGRNIDGMQWSSAKWINRAPDDKVLLRVFFGGPHTRAMLDHDDAELERIVRAEVRDILGITAEPLFCTLRRWHKGYPQYDVGHLDRVRAIESALPADIAVAGNAYQGVGVPDTIKTAIHAIEKLAKETA